MLQLCRPQRASLRDIADFKPMQSRLLHHFLIVCERRNITTAAEFLHITQPALTRSIHKLEKSVGAKLFERLPTGVALTSQGEILARRAKLMEQEYRHALAEIRTLEHGLSGTLRIGAGPVWYSNILPPVMAAFQKQFPKVRMRLTGGVINTLIDGLLGGEIDLMCGTLDFRAQAEIAKEPLLRIRHAVVARKGHPLARPGVVAARELVLYPWLVLADDQIGVGRIGAYFAANSLTPPLIAIETNSYAMYKLLAQGDFIAHFPEQMLADAQKFGLTRIAHAGTFWESEAGIAYRAAANPVKALTSFISMLKVALPADARLRVGVAP
jgi:DNA-binding transcriptional LysR family regulator